MTASRLRRPPSAAHCGCASACRRWGLSCSFWPPHARGFRRFAAPVGGAIRALGRPGGAHGVHTRSHVFLALPARLDDAGNLAAHRVFAQLVATEAELAEHAARTAGKRATVAETGGVGVARQLLQLEPRREA